jgi:hypothetical protein
MQIAGIDYSMSILDLIAMAPRTPNPTNLPISSRPRSRKHAAITSTWRRNSLARSRWFVAAANACDPTT